MSGRELGKSAFTGHFGTQFIRCVIRVSHSCAILGAGSEAHAVIGTSPIKSTVLHQSYLMHLVATGPRILFPFVYLTESIY